MDARLHTSSDLKVIGSTADFAYKWGLNAGLAPENALHFKILATEIMTDIVRFAYPDEPGEVEVEFRIHMGYLEMIFREYGEPFDLDSHHYNPAEAKQDGNYDGAGFAIMKALCDEFLFVNRGREGKEFRFVTHIDAKHITELYQQESLKSPEHDISPVNFNISPIDESDAEDIAKLIYRTYGLTYVKEDLYYPKRIQLSVKNRQKLGVMVRTWDGEPVGYFAILRTTDSKIGEIGEAAVAPKFRRRGVMKMMLSQLIQIAEQAGLLGLFGEAVAAHQISQKVNALFGFKSTAILLANFPTATFKGIEEDYPQEIPVINDFLPLQPPDDVVMFAPRVYEDILCRIFASMGYSVQVLPGAGSIRGETEFRVNVEFEYHVATVTVVRYGEDLGPQLNKVLSSMKDQHINCLYVDLPLDDSQTPQAYEVFKQKGFIFSGLMPLFHQERNFLRLQYPLKTVDLSVVELFSENSKAIMTLIEEEYHEVAT